MTCARGSSAHAATFAKHLIERYLGIAGGGGGAEHRQRLSAGSCACKDQLVLAISQSGQQRRSHRVGATARRRRRADGRHRQRRRQPARGSVRHSCCRSAAGPERSVAATKTFVATLAALLRLTAPGPDDPALTPALDRLPERLAAASELDWSAALGALAPARQPGRHRPRPDAGDRARGGAEAEGDLQPPCRGLQRRRVPARADGAGVARAIRS